MNAIPIRRPTLLAVTIGASLLLSSCTTTPPAASPTPVSPPVTSAVPSPSPSPAGTSATAGNATPTGMPQAVATGLEAPWSVVFRNGTPLVSERDSGRILELSPDGTTRAVGDIPGVAAVGEGGLLGLAVDGQGRLYVYSTGMDGNRLQRFGVTGEPGSLALGQPETLVDGIASASYHDGGRIAFGPDGMLYVAIGDAGRRDSSQDLESLNGKILRMTPDGGVPADNPFPDSLVYSYGHRNPQGLAWAEDGTMFATEFGQNTWDELNIITAGANYGWPTVEGIATTGEFTDPVQQWEPTEASPSGMAHIDGTLFIANLRGQVLRAVPVANPSTSATYYDGEFGRIRDVTEAPDGKLWFITNNTDGRGTPGPDDDRILSVDLTRQ
ncbi:PQQ-dependent sugar dehydrogenase [Pseudarthrobacter scleromae]|uniref:Oxidoreductase n=1 Tax=Pseudarthrobacter scleromae TaxID=158897 RepID=A0ABQ2CJW2_9MICC|nr:PQQ-dependent sugar dehydrogenase [Pseudarthrobacter scleromae]GGI90842.1 oxidoreductase [Pseudarthrobacter scleromae]